MKLSTHIAGERREGAAAKGLSQKPKSVILIAAKELRFAAINRQILRCAQNDILRFGIGP